jgi:predicted transglutaminase-like cysteine proteinase
MTDATWNLLQTVNAAVNRLIVPRETRSLSLGEDYWSTPISHGGVLYGDCKEYVIEKRRRLVAAGVPAAALSIAIANVGGEGHAVLLVSTDQGELVLDNLTSQVRPWGKVHYAWIERQSGSNPLDWVSVEPNRE